MRSLRIDSFPLPDPVPTLQKFRHKLAWGLIQNKWLAREAEEESHVVSTVHQLMVAPLHATKYANRRVGLQRKTVSPELPVLDQKMWYATQTHQNLLLLLPNKVDLQVLPCCARCIRVEKGVDHLVWFTRLIGGLGPCSLYLIFTSDLFKIYLVNPHHSKDLVELYLLVRKDFNVSAFSGELLDLVDHT
jgi:hypothetical protein